jgi:antitoxin (DNA-binding transcriptional repressor) of toxin-antitoxin stability system
MPDIMSDMREVNAREFQKTFSKLTTDLAQGQTIAITKKGKPLGFFTKASAHAEPVPMPDFAANLAHMPYNSQDAERIVREILDEAVS